MSVLPGCAVKGVLCDITGVLLESSSSGDGYAVPGSVAAVSRLAAAGIPVRFLTNESQCTRRLLWEKLRRLGYGMQEESILPPALAARALLERDNLRPFLLVHDRVLPDFQGLNTEDPNCVVLGDAVDAFSYRNLNTAFKLIKKLSCPLISLGKGKYYKEDDDLTLDVGPFTAALEFATGCVPIVAGKPDPAFFRIGLASLGLGSDEVVMVGDDVVSDVGGAQGAGIRGALVRTGKYTPADENHPAVTPDVIVDNLAQLVEMILAR